MKKRPSPLEHSLMLHFQSQKSIYIFVTTLFLMGVIFGAVLVNSLDPSQKEGLLHYLGYFFQGLKEENIAEPKVAFQHSFGDHLKTIGLMWILGLSVIGMPVLLILLFLKGLVIGFTVGFLFSKLSWQGLWFAFVSIVPQNLLIIPAMIILTAAGIRFSITLIKNRLIHHRGVIYPHFVSFSLLVTCMAVVMLFSSAFEAYVSPVMMKEVVPADISLK